MASATKQTTTLRTMNRSGDNPLSRHYARLDGFFDTRRTMNNMYGHLEVAPNQPGDPDVVAREMHMAIQENQRDDTDSLITAMSLRPAESNGHTDGLVAYPFQLDSSLSVIMNDRDLISKSWWHDLFTKVDRSSCMEAKIRDLWRIRLSPTGICRNHDRQLICDSMIRTVTKHRRYNRSPVLLGGCRPINYIRLLDLLASLCPELDAKQQRAVIRAILCDEQFRPQDAVIAQYLADDSEEPAGTDDCVKWLFRTDLIDLSLVSSMLSRLPPYLGAEERLALVQATRDTEIQYMYHVDNRISLLAS